MALVIALLGFILLACAPLAAACALRLGLVGTVLAVYVLAFAEVVLGAELLSPFHAIDPPGLLAWEAAVAVTAAAEWIRRGRPRPALPHVNLAMVRAHPILLGLGSAVAIALAFEFFLALAAPPNNWDALAYHLSRAAAWYQHGSIGFFDSHTVRENTYPGNAEIQVLVTMVFTHGDRLVSLPQLAAELAILATIFGSARRLGFRRSEAAFASLLFATLSEVALESTTTQNDLVMTAPLVAAAYFVLGRTRHEGYLAAVALAVALGTKFTAVYAVPLLLALTFFCYPRRRVLELAAASVAAFALVGCAVYAQNEVHYGTPLGSSDDRAVFTPAVTPTGVVSTTARTLYRFVDLSGFGATGYNAASQQQIGGFVFRELGIAANPPSATFAHFSFWLNTRADEDISYFGPLGALLLLPLALGYLGSFLVRRTSRLKALFALALPLVAIEIGLTYKYNAWLGRFMILPVAFGAVLVARAYSLRLLSAVLAAVGAASLALTLTHDVRKPVGSQPIWSLPRLQGEALSLTSPTTFEALDALVPSHARLGTDLGDDDWDYPLYGPHLTRRLVVLPVRDPFAAARTRGLDWVVIGAVHARRDPTWTTASIGPWTLAAAPHTAAARKLAAFARSAGAL